MGPLIEALSASDLAQLMRNSRWIYAAVSGLHVMGIGLLIGAIASLDLRLIGLWPSAPVAVLARILVPVAVAGLSLAFISGPLLFLAGPADYLRLRLFLVKLALIAIGTVHALWFHAGGGFDRPKAALRRAGIIALSIWIAVLCCGRLLAFVD